MLLKQLEHWPILKDLEKLKNNMIAGFNITCVGDEEIFHIYNLEMDLLILIVSQNMSLNGFTQNINHMIGPKEGVLKDNIVHQI